MRRDRSILLRPLCVRNGRWVPRSPATSECLELLRSYEASWKNIKWSKDSTILPSHSGEQAWGREWKLYGNIWAQNTRERDATDSAQFLSRLRGIHMRRWTLRFDFAMQKFGNWHSLLVMIETNLRHS